jgi:hypothetical protein
MQIYPDVMKMVHGKVKVNEIACTFCWDYFVLLMQKLKIGCDDNDFDNIQEHANQVEALSENLIQACIKAGLGMNRVSPYMHIALAHLAEQIRLVGSLSKGGSQGAEYLHQDVQDLTKRHSNKHANNVCGTTLEKIHNKLDAMQDPNFGQRKGKDKHVLPGGNLSKADRLLRDQTYHHAEAKLGKKAYIKTNDVSEDEDTMQGKTVVPECDYESDVSWSSDSSELSSSDESGASSGARMDDDDSDQEM